MTLTKFLNWTIKLATILPFLYWIVGVNQAWLGVEPLVKINSQSGYVVLILLQVNLLVGAIHALHVTDIKWYRFLQMSRRFLGVMCGFYVVLHFLTYLAKESFLPKGWTQIVTKTYLIAGSSSALILLVLALTSNNFSTRLLKKNWKRLHRIIYLASIILLFHIFLIEKANLLLLLIIVVPVLLMQFIRVIKLLNEKITKRSI